MINYQLPITSCRLATNGAFDPPTLAADLAEVRRLYALFLERLHPSDWDRPARGQPHEWTLHETLAHLCALTGAGLDSICATLRGERYDFDGLDDRYQFTAYNRRGIDAHLPLPVDDLCAEFLGILDHAAALAAGLTPAQAQLASCMPIYNRPVTLVEALAIIMFHAGLHHTAQIAEPARVAPLWHQLSPEVRHRVIARVLRALSLLYRHDLGRGLRATLAFRVDGPGGGAWHLALSPESATSADGLPERPSLLLHLRHTDVFCHMFTGRLHLPRALLTGQLKLRGNLLLFPRLGALFSVDARA
jgi:hypothetical protein